MKAIIKKKKKKQKYITIKIIPEIATEERFLNYLLQNEEFIIKTHDSISFVVSIIKCDTCKFNIFHKEVDGTRNGKECKIKLGKCNCPDKDLIETMVPHPLENDFKNCFYYEKKVD